MAESCEGLSGPLRLLPDGRALLLPPLPCALEGMRVLRAGLLLGEAAKGRFVPAHALAMARGLPLKLRVELSEADALKYLRGETLPASVSGWCVVTHEGLALGLAKGADGILKNHLPKGLRII
jgi:NOL1/NOP2/fmu family ribosome biogenesis protein